jgi:hypothetical protein
MIDDAEEREPARLVAATADLALMWRCYGDMAGWIDEYVDGVVVDEPTASSDPARPASASDGRLLPCRQPDRSSPSRCCRSRSSWCRVPA